MVNNLNPLKPLVSIGMPVYNSENFIGPALESLLLQDYENFNIIISDNASTDSTEMICREYMAKDKRISYFRNQTNFGSGYNFKRVFDLSSGDYFMWAGSHDLWTPDFISRLVNVLREYPDVVLTYTETYWIDDDGKSYDINPYHLDTRGMTLSDRISFVIKTLYACDLFYGLYRTSVLKKCRVGVNSLGPDHVLLMEISLLGEIAEIPGKGFIRRVLRSGQISYPSDKIRVETMLLKIDPTFAKRKNVRAYWEWGWQHILGILAAPISSVIKFPLLVVAAITFSLRFKTELYNDVFHPAFPKTAIEKRGASS